MSEDQKDDSLQVSVRGGGFRPPRLDYFITNIVEIEKDDSINKKLSEWNITAGSIINFEIKSRPDPSVSPKNTTIIVFYKKKNESQKYIADYFFSTIGDVEDNDSINKYMAIKSISANDIISVTSTRCERKIGVAPNITVIVHVKRQSNGAD